MFITIKMDGCLDAWDYHSNQSEPALVLKVTDGALTSFRMQEGGAVAAVGSAAGSTTILHFSRALTDMQPNEKQAISAVLLHEPCTFDKHLSIEAAIAN